MNFYKYMAIIFLVIGVVCAELWIYGSGHPGYFSQFWSTNIHVGTALGLSLSAILALTAIEWEVINLDNKDKK